MNPVRYLTDVPQLVEPVMVAGWPGMGSVALGVVDYLVKRLDAAMFAEIAVDPLAYLDSVVVEEGIAAIPDPPRHSFYYTKNPDMVIFEGEAQVSGQAGADLLAGVLDVAVKLKVKRIFTGAAFPLPISYKEDPVVYGAANKKELVDFIVRSGVRRMENGHISGLNGLVLGFAAERNIEALCLLATIPQYAINLPNPKASAAIIDVLRRINRFEIDLGSLDDYIRDMDEKMAVIEEKVRDVFTIEGEEHPQHPSAESAPPGHKLPDNIIEKIEKLFEDARADKSKAADLKRELDRWDLFKLYEDRFLDLFKGDQ